MRTVKIILLILFALPVCAPVWAQTGNSAQRDNPQATKEWKAALAKADSIRLEDDPAKKVRMLDTWRSDMPAPAANILLLLDRVYGDIAAAYAEKENIGKALYYLNRIQDRNNRDLWYGQAALVLQEKPAPAMLAHLLQPIVDTMLVDSSRSVY